MRHDGLPAGSLGKLGVPPSLPAVALDFRDVIHGVSRDPEPLAVDLAGGSHAHDFGTAPVLVQHQTGDGPALGLGVFRGESHGEIVPPRPARTEARARYNARHDGRAMFRALLLRAALS